MPKLVDRCRASSSSSTNEPVSSSTSIRSRAVILPLACCFSTARAEPACTASSMRRSRSASLPAVVWMSMSAGHLGPAVADRGRRPHCVMVRSVVRCDEPLRATSTGRRCAAAALQSALTGDGSLWTEVRVVEATGVHQRRRRRRRPRRQPRRAWCSSPSSRPPAGAGWTAAGRRRRGPGSPSRCCCGPPVPRARWGWLPLLTGVARGRRRSPSCPASSSA